MLRSLRAVQHMRKVIIEKKLTVMATISRFACAYTSIGKPDYWYKSLQYVNVWFVPKVNRNFCDSGGPIMEQATHVCDLSRYFAGEVDISSISACTIEWDEKPGDLSYIDDKCLEGRVLPEDKIPRGTAANWSVVGIVAASGFTFLRPINSSGRKYENGGIGSLVHIVALHGDEYACDFEVIADGYLFR